MKIKASGADDKWREKVISLARKRLMSPESIKNFNYSPVRNENCDKTLKLARNTRPNKIINYKLTRFY